MEQSIGRPCRQVTAGPSDLTSPIEVRGDKGRQPARSAGAPSGAGAAGHLNPIEQVFAKLKTLMRKAAERTVEVT